MSAVKKAHRIVIRDDNLVNCCFASRKTRLISLANSFRALKSIAGGPTYSFSRSILVDSIDKTFRVQEHPIFSRQQQYESTDSESPTTSYPLSQTQERIWFGCKVFTDPTIFTTAVAVKIVGNLQLGVLEKAWDLATKKHESLRTQFSERENGQPFQYIVPPQEATNQLEIIHNEWGSLDDLGDNNIVDRLSSKPFNLKKSCLYQIHLICSPNKNEYILFLRTHNLIADADTINILLKELGESYNTLLKGDIVETQTPLSSSFKTFTMMNYNEAEKQYLAQESSLAIAKSFWLKTLSSCQQQQQQLTVDLGPKTNCKDTRYNTISLKLTDEELKALLNFTTTRDYSLFTALSAALGLVLKRYFEQDSFVLNYASRSLRGTKFGGLVNSCLNTLLLPMHFSTNLKISDLLKDIEMHCLEARNFDYYPINHLIRALQKENSDISLPNVSINETRLDFDGCLALAGCSTQPIKIKNNNSPLMDLSLDYYYDEDQEELHFKFAYKTEVFTEEMIKQLISSYKLIIQQFIHDMDQTVSQVPILTEENKRILSIDWNQTRVNYPQANSTIPELFEKYSETTPYAKAVVYGDQSLTYHELNSKSNQLAYYLKNLGLGKEDIIAISFERGLEFIISLLAIMKAGAAFLPISPKIPIERVASILKDSEAKLLLTNANRIRLSNLVTTTKTPICYFDELDLNSLSKVNLPSTLRDSNCKDLAYVIYTSGSTGTPKGVPIEHHSLVNEALWWQDYFSITPQDNFSMYADTGFDAFLNETIPALISGACIYVIQEEHKLSLEILNDYFNQNNITVSFLPTPVYETFSGLSNTSLRILVVAGDNLTHFLSSSQNPYQVYNAYGPTENTICSTISCLVGGDKITIGRPIANVKLYVMDKSQQLVPIGMVGELYLGGQGVARGYLNKPDLTKERFIDNPFASEEEKKSDQNLKLYKTGDLVRYLPDGRLIFLNRLDNQIKLRGFRIELGEIESTLKQILPGKEIAIIARNDNSTNTQLVAYIVDKPDDEKSYIQYIREVLNKHLPDYMIPSAFVFLEKFPLTVNGKLDKKILPSPDHYSLKNHHFIAPRNEREQQMISVWANLLKIKASSISINHSFFELGGHSLLVGQLVQILKKQFNFQVGMGDIFSHPTIAGLSEAMERSRGGGDNSISSETQMLNIIQADGNKPPLFLIHPAEGLSLDFKILKGAIANQPIFGVNHPYFASNEQKFSSFNKLVHHYLQFVKKTQNEGPYQLGGYCFGGFTALELALRLEKQGQKVETVILFECMNIAGFPETQRDPKSYESLTKKDIPDYDRKGYSFLLGENADEMLLLILKNRFRSEAILKGYLPPPYSGRVILIRGRELSPIEMSVRNEDARSFIRQRFEDPLFGWEGLLPNLEIITTIGDHNNILDEENIETTSKTYSQCFTEISLADRYPTYTVLERNLLAAAQRNDDFMVRLCITRNSNLVSLRDSENGWTVLQWAIYHNNRELIQWLSDILNI